MFQNLSNQLRQNPRLRWGVALIIGTCWLYGVLLLRGATLALARLSGQLTQTEWLARVTPAQTLAVQLEGKLWQAATSGLAQAAFQDMLNGAMANAAVPRPQISVTVVDDMAATPPDLWKVKAKLGFDFTAASLLALLQLLETHPKQIVVGSLGVNKDQPNRVDLELYAYFQKPTQPLAPL